MAPKRKQSRPHVAHGGSTKKRSTQKILDAFQIAQRAEEGEQDSDEGSGDDLVVRGGIMDASSLLGKPRDTKKRSKRRDSDDELEDEEIDSDGVLGSDDDYDVMNSKFSQTIRDKAKKKQSKAEFGDDDAYDSIDESQLVGLSEAWDMDDKDAATPGSKSDVVLQDDWQSELSELEDSESALESESDVFNQLGEEEEENSDIDLANTVSKLQAQIKKPKERKRLLAEKADENEFNLPTKGVKLSLRDMMGDSHDAALIDRDNAKLLSAPLPKRIQERHDRRVAYDIAKEDVSKWDDVVQQNRRAEVLHFPMNGPPKHNDAALTFKADNVPATELERAVHGLLEQSALVDDQKEATFEDIAVAKLLVEEMRRRNNELKLMRELMFREEKRARRIKKIKSKLYHKIKRKERMRNQELVEGSDDDEEDHDIKRAQERMLLKHKTQLLWAKSMIKSGLSKDASNRGELEEMLRQGERLRAKQLGYEDGNQSDKGVSDIEAEYQQEAPEVPKLGKGVLEMDFMKKADSRARAANLQELAALRSEEDDPSGLANVTKNQGRRVYTPSVAPLRDELVAIDAKTRDEVETDELKSLATRLAPKANDALEEEANPWMAEPKEHRKRSKNVSAVDETSLKLSKATHKIQRRSAAGAGAGAGAGPDVTIDVEQTLQVVDAYGSDTESFQQKELIREAFAGDDVVKEFEAEKRQVVAEEGDKEEDLTMPGWGDWAVAGKKSKKGKVVRKIDGVVQLDKRKDKHKKNVIVNERVNKKNLKYQSLAVPFPYESREQYERALRMPVGQEWTSRETHQKLTMPRVITKQGTVIDPLKAPFK